MRNDPRHVADLERINYLATQPIVQVIPDMELILREDVILTSSKTFPSPDANHACLMRANIQTANQLLDEVIDYFTEREINPTIFISPACTPADWHERLISRGFTKQAGEEAWMVYYDLQAAKAPPVDSRIVVKQVSPADVPVYAEVMAAAFEMPPEWIPVLASQLLPSVGLPGIHYYLGFIDHQPVATLNLKCFQNYASVGAASVIPRYRGSKTLYTLAAKVLLEAQQMDIDVILLQTTLGPVFERFIRICGFATAFKRHCYMLS